MTKVNRGQVIEAAYELLDSTGLEDFSMRKLASRLGIKAASVYWYFDSKEKLFAEMADGLLVEVANGSGPTLTGEDKIRHVAFEVRDALISRRDGARLFTLAYPLGENVLRVLEELSHGFLEYGIPEDKLFVPKSSLFIYTVGLALNEQSFPSQRIEIIMKTDYEAIALRHPMVAAAFHEFHQTDFRARLEYGIRLHLSAAVM